MVSPVDLFGDSVILRMNRDLQSRYGNVLRCRISVKRLPSRRLRGELRLHLGRGGEFAVLGCGNSRFHLPALFLVWKVSLPHLSRTPLCVGDAIGGKICFDFSFLVTVVGLGLVLCFLSKLYPRSDCKCFSIAVEFGFVRVWFRGLSWLLAVFVIWACSLPVCVADCAGWVELV